MNINISDNVETKESLVNNKPWFNGMKTFSSVKINPAPLKDSILEINVFDSIASGDKLA